MIIFIILPFLPPIYNTIERGKKFHPHVKNRRSAATIQRMLRILLEWFALSQFSIMIKKGTLLRVPCVFEYQAVTLTEALSPA